MIPRYRNQGNSVVTPPESHPDSLRDCRGNPCGCPNQTVGVSLVDAQTGDTRANANPGNHKGCLYSGGGASRDHPARRRASRLQSTVVVLI